MRLRDKVAIITGSSSGMGLAAAKLFAREGAKIAIIDVKWKEGEDALKEIQKAGGEGVFIKADVSKIAELQQMAEETCRAFGKIDILYNNAGIHPDSSRLPLAECPEDVWNRLMEINFKSVFLASKVVIPYMMRNGKGSIINTSTIYAFVAAKSRSAYTASKGGIVPLSKSMAIDYAPYNIRVNCICPGAIETDLSREYFNNARKDPQVWQEFMKTIPLARVAGPEEVAYAALFLASDESSYITGTELIVDGGYSAQ